MTNTPDPMVAVVAETCFVNKETAAWMLEKLSEKGYKLERDYNHDYEKVRVNLPMACWCSPQGKQEFSDLIDEYLATCGKEWLEKYYVPELTLDYLMAEFAMNLGEVKVYGDQWFGVSVDMLDTTNKIEYHYYVECDMVMYGLLYIWKDAVSKNLCR